MMEALLAKFSCNKSQRENWLKGLAHIITGLATNWQRQSSLWPRTAISSPHTLIGETWNLTVSGPWFSHICNDRITLVELKVLFGAQTYVIQIDKRDASSLSETARIQSCTITICTPSKTIENHFILLQNKRQHKIGGSLG